MNEAADECGIERQLMRKYVGEFEKQTKGRLIRDEHDHKRIPADFLHIFQRAQLYAATEKATPAMAMLYALKKGEQYQLSRMSKAVEDLTEIIRLKRDLEHVLQELKGLRNKPQTVKVDVTDNDDVSIALDSNNKKTLVICLLVGVLIGLVLGVLLARFVLR